MFFVFVTPSALTQPDPALERRASTACPRLSDYRLAVNFRAVGFRGFSGGYTVADSHRLLLRFFFIKMLEMRSIDLRRLLLRLFFVKTLQVRFVDLPSTVPQIRHERASKVYRHQCSIWLRCVCLAAFERCGLFPARSCYSPQCRILLA